jgi:hypothetical protein
MRTMRYVLVLQAGSPAPHYTPLIDRLHRLGAQRILRTAWIVEGASPRDVYDSILMWAPCTDGVLVLAYGEERFERNLRVAQPASRQAARAAEIAVLALDQGTPP